MSREIMQQALDIIKKSRSVYGDDYPTIEEFDVIKAIEAELAKPEQEPVMVRIGDSKWFHIQPPRKEWVGLTDDEFKFIASKYSLNTGVGLGYFHEEIEAKLKELNT